MSLIDGVRSSDVESWRRMVDLYSPLVYFWITRQAVPKQDIRDIFQDVFFSVAKSIHQFQPRQNGSFRGWLRTVTRSKVNDYFRGQIRHPKPFGGTEAKHFFDQLPGNEETTTNSSHNRQLGTSEQDFEHMEKVIHDQLLRKALTGIRDSIHDQTWRAFWMVAVEGRATSEVAESLSMQPGAVRVAKSRVLKRLREYLGGPVG